MSRNLIQYESSAWRRTKKLEPVVYALESGFQPAVSNATARNHFYFHGPVDFEVHWYSESPTFKIGNETTDYIPRAMELLKAVKF